MLSTVEDRLVKFQKNQNQPNNPQSTSIKE